MYIIKYICFILALVTNTAMAETWTGEDKAIHFGATAIISSAVTAYTGNENTGFWTGVTVGAVKELSDINRPNHVASFKDFAWDILGSYVGTKIGGYMFISKSDNSKTHITLGFQRSF